MRISDWSSDVCSSDLFGALDLFAPQVLKPESTRWRLALWAASRGQPMTSSPAAGAATLDVRAREPAGPALKVSGFRELGDQAVRIDLIERVAEAAHSEIGRASCRERVCQYV